MEWQDISTAPKDGTYVLLWCEKWSSEIDKPCEDKKIAIGYWDDGTNDRGNDPDEGKWWVECGGTYYTSYVLPTQWMPLPPLPVKPI